MIEQIILIVTAQIIHRYIALKYRNRSLGLVEINCQVIFSRIHQKYTGTAYRKITYHNNNNNSAIKQHVWSGVKAQAPVGVCGRSADTCRNMFGTQQQSIRSIRSICVENHQQGRLSATGIPCRVISRLAA